MLKTKSIQAKKNKQDGIRICIMRRIKPEYDFDMWMPKLAPSEKLLQAYVINKQLNWQEFIPLFIDELKINSKVFKLIIKLARRKNVTLLCWEKIPDNCHRSIVAKICQRVDDKLKVVIN